MPDLYAAKTEYQKHQTESIAWWKEVITNVLKNAGEEKRNAVLGSYQVLPDHRFITQQEDEDIVLLLRAHPITNIPWILVAIIMLILPGFLMSTGMFANVHDPFLLIGRMTWYLMTLMFIMEKILYWYYSVFIITNERIVDIDFYNLMFRVVTYANLNHIEEPASVTGGFIRSLFRYGDIWVTTASEKPSVEGLGIPYPDKVVEIISRLSEELEKRREQGK
jgi:membrane protein YdbS with pleckstrin-like domain